MNTTMPRDPQLSARLRRAQNDTLRPQPRAGASSRATHTTRRAAPRRASSTFLGGFAVRALLWVALVGLSYAGSTLLGQTMLEQARREGLRAQARARDANMDAAMLRDRLRRLTSMRAVDEWATVRGFTPQEQALVVLGGPMRVARR